jgi:hypothetical protein
LQLKKNNNVREYEDLTKKQQDHARTLPNGFYVENITIQMRILRSDTTISPTIQTDALSDIDIDYPPAIRREPKNPRPKHVQKNLTSPSKILLSGRNVFLSKQQVIPMSSTTHQKNRYWCTTSKPFINL